MRNALEVERLTKRFGDFTAVDNISFTVREGEIFGFLGANGAGKTTAMRMLCGLSRPTSGEARVAGFDVYRERRARLGWPVSMSIGRASGSSGISGT